ncbi:MAG: DUF3313 family protein [Methylococcales bacterium]|nr:DUF3313 family protein [Methylococcales bacterium]MBT7409948.1 DUF3313 family protein [Methylococcales bacterium]
MRHTIHNNKTYKWKLIFCLLTSISMIGCSMLPGGGGSGDDDDDESETETSGFLKSYDNLETMEGRSQTQYYENSGANWKKYNQVYIAPVEIKSLDAENAMSPRDQKLLGDYFEIKMRQAVQAKYKLATKPGPGVLNVRTAIVEANPTKTLRSSGSVKMEGELLDGETGNQLIAIIDSRSGSMFQLSKTTWKDGFDEWATQLYGVLSSKLGEVSVTANNTMKPEKSKVENWLKMARNDLEANRLTTPVGNSALERFRSVLEVDASNEEANKGIDTIVRTYISWGERALSEGRRSTAWYYLDKARFIHEDNEAVTRLSKALAQTANQPRYQPAPAEIKEDDIEDETEIEIETTMAPIVSAPIASTPIVTASVTPKASAPTKYSLNISTNPANATVQMIDTKKSYRPGIMLNAGKYSVKISASGYESETQVVSLTKNSNIKISLKKKESAFDPWGGVPGKGSANLNSGKLKPYVLGIETTGDIISIVKAAKSRLKKEGFSIAGDYSPFSNTHIIAVTNSTLKSIAKKTEYGGYGAMIRVSVTKAGERVQVAYTNPYYSNNIYRMKGNIASTASSIGKALGKEKTFGSKKGIKAKGLRDWHYMFGMPYFDDQIKLASHGSQSAAVSKVTANLKANKGGTTLVYKIDLGKETVFGVGIKSGKGADKTVMGSIDSTSTKHSAHLPYDILVRGGKVYTMNGKFRIALSFPDLTMKQFMSIADAPDAIEEVLKKAAN